MRLSRRTGEAVVLLVAAAVVSAGCGTDEGPGGEATGMPDTRTEVSPADEGPEPPASSLEVTGEMQRSEVEIRVGELLTQLEATPEPAGTVVEIDDTVLFDFDSAVLRPEAAGVLDAVAEVLRLLGDAPARVRGHTDTVGGDDYNLRLSAQRAEAVRDYLAGAGVDAGLLSTEGVGSAEPVAPNSHPDGSDNPDGRAQNRRVEIVLPTVDLDQLPQG